jgi:hypothetical protein
VAGPATEGRCPDLRLRFGRASELINQELRVITNAADGVTIWVAIYRRLHCAPSVNPATGQGRR